MAAVGNRASRATGSATADPVVLRAGRAVAWLAKQAELALADVDLTLAQYRVLGLLAEGTAASSSLSDRLAVRPPSLTTLVDVLAARGLVDRAPDPADRRRVTLSVTPAGLHALATADAALDERLAEVASWLGDDDGGAAALDDLGRWSAALRARHLARHEGTR